MLHTVSVLDELDIELTVLKIDVSTLNYKQQHLNHYVHHKLHKKKLHQNPNIQF